MRNYLLVAAFLMAMPSYSLFTDEQVNSYKVPNNSVVVDGDLDSVIIAVSNERDAVSRIFFNDCEKILLIGKADLRGKPPCDTYSPPPGGSINMVSAYDDDFIYLFFVVRENDVYNGVSSCPSDQAWKADAIEIFLDPQRWDESSYTQQFGQDAESKFFGSSQYTIQINKPIHPDDDRVFLADREIDDVFEYRETEEFLRSHEGFEIATKNNEQNQNIVAIEMKIPRWANSLTASGIGGFGTYFTYGYNNYTLDKPSDCSDNPIGYRWAKHYKRINCYGDEVIPGCDKDSTHYDPSRSREGWGQLYFETFTVEADPSLKPAPPIDPEKPDVSIRPSKFQSNHQFRQIGNRLYLPETNEKWIKIYDYTGNLRAIVPVLGAYADIEKATLEKGLYFGVIDGFQLPITAGMK